jgi:hypothetical protein
MEAIRSSETSVDVRSTERYIPEDILHSYNNIYWYFYSIMRFQLFATNGVCLRYLFGFFNKTMKNQFPQKGGDILCLVENLLACQKELRSLKLVWWWWHYTAQQAKGIRLNTRQSAQHLTYQMIHIHVSPRRRLMSRHVIATSVLNWALPRPGTVCRVLAQFSYHCLRFYTTKLRKIWV